MRYAALLSLLAIGLTAIVASKIHAQTSGPAVEITSPAEGSVITNSTTYVTFASTGTCYKFQLFVDGKSAGTITLGKSKQNYFTWNSGHAGIGEHVLNVKATDMNGNWAVSDDCHVFCQ